MQSVKCFILGDSFAGKTSLAITVTTGVCPVEYVPTAFDNYSAEVELDGRKIFFTLWDAAGGEDYERTRPLSYPGTDVFAMVFACNRRAQLTHIVERFLPEIRLHAPRVPWVLVMSKTDLLDDASVLDMMRQKGETMVTDEEAMRVQFAEGGSEYVRVSSLRGEGIQEWKDVMLRVGARVGKYATVPKQGGGGDKVKCALM